MASQSVFYRDFPACGYFVRDDGDYITVETAALRLTYRKDSEFTSETLSIALKEEPSGVWHYGDVVETLGGTAKTLDSVNDGIPLEEGLCSRSGFAVLDDSETMLLNEQGWVEPRREKGADLYFFGYGYDYRGCIKDFYRLTGVPPLLPAYALGNWWSRYYAYTQQEYMDLMSRFEEEDIPFSVAVIDMDWHIVDVPENLKPRRSVDLRRLLQRRRQPEHELPQQKRPERRKRRRNDQAEIRVEQLQFHHQQVVRNHRHHPRNHQRRQIEFEHRIPAAPAQT